MKQQQKLGKRNKIGGIGELVAIQHLKKRGFTVLATNYLKKWGEIDIIVEKWTGNKRTVHFVEVKSVSYETKQELQKAVSRDTWRPEEKVHHKKQERMKRTIETWIAESNLIDTTWQIDVITVKLVPREKYAVIKYIENIILG